MMIKLQPIDKAPRDGTFILGTNDFCNYYRCRFMTAEDLAEEHGGSPSGYVDECWDTGDDCECPTHWIPMPTKPEDGE